jgi:putative aldouronate transport system substrate-binding protein
MMKRASNHVLLLLTCAMLALSLSGFAAAEGNAPGEVTYPVETTETLTYWIDLNAQNVAPNFNSFNDTEFAKYIQEETGIKIEYMSPPVGNQEQSFNLLVASGNMPDIIAYDWAKPGRYPGGPEAAIANKVILPLNDLLEKYAPDLMKILKDNPEYDKMVKTDSGQYYIFPVMKMDDYLNTTYGLVLRGDWLQELDLEVPVTIDDWHEVLTAFKEKKGAEYPYTYSSPSRIFNPFENGMFIGAFGITKNWYLEGDKVTFGPYEAGYKDWLATMAKWYSEGLIDNNFATNDQAAMDSNILNGLSGATSLWLGSGLGKYLPGLRATDPNATLVAAPYPVLKEGDTPQFNSLLNPFDGAGACITTSCKNPELAVKFLNYGYTEKGRKTYNYGREGISYTYDDQGVVHLTDAVTKNPDGWPIGQAWSKYAHGVYPGPYFSERRFLELYYRFPEQLDGLDKFTATNMRAHLLPPISPNQEESAEFARIMTDVQAYLDEYTLTAIMGTVDIESTYEGFVAEMKRLGMDRAIEIQQTAFDRYNAR